MRSQYVLPLALAFATAGAAPAFAAFPGENGRILFESFRAGGEERDIWTMSSTGRHVVNLTAGSEAFDGQAKWRPDGRKIVFMSDRATPSNPTPPDFPSPDFELFVMDANGSHVRQITFNDRDDETPAWSPDGKQIVFTRDHDPIRGQADNDLYTIRADGTRERNLTNSPGVQDLEPDWSPDGDRIAFAGERDGDSEIYTMKPDGSRLRQLTANAAWDSEPSWSPDGRRVAFTSDRDATDETPFQSEIYSMRADGGDQTRLTFDDLSDFYPAWSPDGRRIAFATFRDVTEQTRDNAEVYTMRADGRQLTNVTESLGFDSSPDWQPLDDHRHHGW